MAATFGGNGGGLAGSLDPKTGIYTYADGSTYQNPYQYGTSWDPNSANGTATAYNAAPAVTGNASVPQYPGDTYQTKPEPYNQGGAVWGGTSQPSLSGALKASAAAMNANQVAGISGYTAGMNPYLQQQGDALTRGITNNLQNNVLPGISAASIANGNFGGSRQGVIEANALNDANGQIASGLSNLYGNGYNSALQYDLSRRGQDQNFGLGLGNLGLGYQNAQNNYDLGLRNNALGIGNLDYQYANLDRGIYNDNRQWQLQGANLGLNAYNQGLSNSQGGINAGTNIQNTPLDYWNQMSNGANSIGRGYGTQTSTTRNATNPFLNVLGGAQLGSQIYNQFAGPSNGGWSTMPNQNVFMGTGSMGD